MSGVTRNRMRAGSGWLFAAGALVLLGLWRGEHLDVFTKAITLCLECLGLR